MVNMAGRGEREHGVRSSRYGRAGQGGRGQWYTAGQVRSAVRLGLSKADHLVG